MIKKFFKCAAFGGAWIVGVCVCLCVGLFLCLCLVVFIFGFPQRWDSMSAPDLAGPGAMAMVNQFIAKNRWNMTTNSPFFNGVSKPITGLPWKSLKGKTYDAVTVNGILYVLSNPGFHHDFGGVAYNPNTNKFAPTIRGFKPIGGHWYVWAEPEFQSVTLDQKYE